MREKEEFFLRYRGKEVLHGRATTGTGLANFLEKGKVLVWTSQARAVPGF